MSLLVQHASVLVAGACMLICWWAYLRVRLNAVRMNAAMDRARADRAFSEWARLTFVSVVDEEGELFYRSLKDLQDVPEDLGWLAPRSTLIVHPTPDEPDPYGHAEEANGHG